MTNADLHDYLELAPCRPAQLQEDGSTYYFACGDGIIKNPWEFAIVTDPTRYNHKQKQPYKVGIACAFGSEVYIYTPPGFRGQGHMSRFMKSRIFQKMFPYCTKAEIVIDNCPLVAIRYHLAKLGGFEIVNENKVQKNIAFWKDYNEKNPPSEDNNDYEDYLDKELISRQPSYKEYIDISTHKEALSSLCTAQKHLHRFLKKSHGFLLPPGTKQFEVVHDLLHMTENLLRDKIKMLEEHQKDEETPC